MSPIQNSMLLTPNWANARSQGTPQAALLSNPGQRPALAELQQRALDNLAQHIPGVKNAKGFETLKADEFTPEKVSERIAGFVEMGLASAKARGASEQDLQSLRDQAQRGVEKGFKDAREILKGLDMLNGRVAEQVDETERLTFAKLQGLDGESAAPLTTPGAWDVSVGERFAKAESLSMTLTTQSGKTVTVDFARADVMQSRMQASAQGGQSQWAMDVSRYSASGYQFSVSGELSDAELQAMQDLVQDVAGMANEFFNGDVQKALEQVGDLRFDSQQLASMDLNMTRVESYTMVQRYTETERLTETGAQDERPGLRLGQLMQEMRDRFNADILSFLEQPQQSAGRLFEGLVTQDSRFQEASAPQQQQLQTNLDKLLESVGVPSARS